MSQKELLRVEHLKKYFQTPRGTLSAVEDVSFRIEERDPGRGGRERLRQVHPGPVYPQAP